MARVRSNEQQAYFLPAYIVCCEHQPVNHRSLSSGGAARAGAFVTAGLAAQSLISMVSGLVVARAIGPAAYGLFSLARNACETVNLFTKVGFDVGLVRWLPARAGDARVAAGYVVVSGVIVTGLSLIPVVAVLAGGGMLLENQVYSHPGFAGVIDVMIWMLPLMALTQLLGGAFRGHLDIRPRVIAEMFLQPAGRLVIILAWFVVSVSLSAVVWGTVISYALALTYLAWRAKFFFSTDAAGWQLPPYAEVLALTKYSAILSLTLSAALLLQRMDILMLGHYRSAEELGQYAVLQMVVPLIVLVNTAFSQLLAPTVSHLASRNDMTELKAVVHRHGRWVTLSSFPVFLILATLGVDLVRVFGEAYRVDAVVIVLLALSQIVMAMLSASGFLLSMTNAYKRELPILAINLVLNFVLNLLWIPSFGMAGAAAATLISVLAANLIRLQVVRRIYAFATLSREVLPPMLVAFVALVPVIAVRVAVSDHSVIGAFVAATFYFLIYAAVLYRYGLSAEDRVLAQRIVQRYI